MLQIWSKMKFLSALYHMGVKYVKKVLGTGRDGQLTQINVKFWKNWPTLLGPGRFSKDFIPTSIILKGYFIPIKFGAAQTRCIFEVWGHCAAPDWACRKNPWSISYLWTKICWKQSWAGQLFWIETPSGEDALPKMCSQYTIFCSGNKFLVCKGGVKKYPKNSACGIYYTTAPVTKFALLNFLLLIYIQTQTLEGWYDSACIQCTPLCFASRISKTILLQLFVNRLAFVWTIWQFKFLISYSFCTSRTMSSLQSRDNTAYSCVSNYVRGA